VTTASGEGPIMTRVAELDALRAFAAVVILFFHLDTRRYFPGWSGVDLFFVLSGYLITSILLRNLGEAGFLPRFYARRSLRIWPTYYLVLFALVAVNPFLSTPASLKGLPYALTFTQNIPLYWGKLPPAPHPGFDHAWTLALEEQFYLIWPALVLLVGRRKLPWLALAVIALNLACRDGGNGVLPKYPERLLASRSDGFALGGLLAWSLADGAWARLRPELAARAFGGAIALASLYLLWGCWSYSALGFIGLPTPAWPAETIFAFGLLYAGVIGLVALHAGHPWLAPLRAGPLVYLGQISYGLYLYHVVVYWIVDGCDRLRLAQPWPIQAEKLALTLAVAVLSWHLIERPIASWKDRFRYRKRESPPGPGASAGVDSRGAGRLGSVKWRINR